MRGARLLRRWALVAGLVLVLLAALLPFAQFGRFHEPLRAELERALSRKVEINGPLTIGLVPRPTLTLENVVIHDDPSFGLEPLAYVSEMELGVSIGGLLHGRFEFSRIRLVQPSVNLARAAGGWNFPPLLGNRLGPDGDVERAPRIEVRDGRLNFKFSDTKSVFYLSAADVDIVPLTGGEAAVRFEFSGEPSRTDRAAQGFGKFSGNGRLTGSAGGEEARLRMVVRLERSAIQEILTLLRGRGAALGGFLAARAELEGPLSRIAVRGTAELAELDQRFLLPARSTGWALEYAGRLNVPAEELELATATADTGPPVSVRVRLQDYLTKPRWSISISADQLSLEHLPALARAMGAPATPSVQLAGKLTGALGWQSGEPLHGRFKLEQVAVREGEDSAVGIPEAQLTFEGKSVSAPPFAVVLDGGRTATARFDYDSTDDRLRIGVATRGLPVEQTVAVWNRLAVAPPPPLFRTFAAGTWRGDFTCVRERDRRERWDGKIELTDVPLEIAGLAGQTRILKAAADPVGRRIEFEAEAGGIPVRGVYEQTGDRDWPAGLSLELKSLSAAAVQELFAPTLHWRRLGFIARTLRLPAPPLPDWLNHRRIAGTLRIGELVAGPVRFDSLEGTFHWEAGLVRMAVAEALSGRTKLDGRLSVDLARGVPDFDVSARVRALPWAGGLVDVDGQLTTSGLGVQLIANAAASGEFSAGQLHSGGGQALDSVRGCFEFASRRGVPKLWFPCLAITRGGREFYGSGAAGLTGEFTLDLFNDTGLYTARGRLDPLSLRIREAAAGTVK